MNSIFIIIIVFLLSASVIVQTAERVEDDNANVKKLKYQNSAREIVKDLIANWNSPLAYLQNRGYLRAPQIGVDMLLGEKQSGEVRTPMDDKKMERVARSNKEGGANDLRNLFQTFFASSDNSVSDKIKSKLGVPWDMNALKNSVHNEAAKYYEKFYDKPIQNQASNERTEEVETDIDKQVAQLYPSVAMTSGKEQAAEEKKVHQPCNPAELRSSNYLNGIAKLLTNRVKPLPFQLKRKGSANPSI